MEDKDIISVLSRTVNNVFWDFRCYFVHHPGTFPVDFSFFKLAKKSEIIFGGNDDCIGMYSFEDKGLNKFLNCKTIAESAYKERRIQV